MAIIQKPPRPKRMGWSLTLLLLAVYLFLKVQGWWYVHQVQGVAGQLEEVRPALARIALFHELENSRQLYSTAFEQIRAMDFNVSHFLALLSKKIPLSVTLETVEIHPVTGLRIRGGLLSGVRSPEEVLLPWAESLEVGGYLVKIQELTPERRVAGLWHFQLKLETPQ